MPKNRPDLLARWCRYRCRYRRAYPIALSGRLVARERKRRVILTNEIEPRAGDFAFQFYDKTHPMFGDAETIHRMRKDLRGLAGDTVTAVFKGQRTDPDTGKIRKFQVTRTFRLRSYRDMFGPGSALASAAHYVRDKYSNEELVITSVTVDESSPGDVDSEEG